jgi:hypothetical protein
MKTSVAAAILAATACARAILGAALLVADDAVAADLGYSAHGSGFAGYGPPPAPPPFAFAVDPRCSIVPMPQLDLAGDTARFRATAVCQSRGLYTDSLMFPGPAGALSRLFLWAAAVGARIR